MYFSGYDLSSLNFLGGSKKKMDDERPFIEPLINVHQQKRTESLPPLVKLSRSSPKPSDLKRLLEMCRNDMTRQQIQEVEEMIKRLSNKKCP